MVIGARISKGEKENMKAVAKNGRTKKITDLENQIQELKKSPMIEVSSPLQRVLNKKIVELKILKGEESNL